MSQSNSPETTDDAGADINNPSLPQDRKKAPNVLTPPTVPDALELLPDESAYLIDRDTQEQPLKVAIPERWPGATALPAIIEYYWDNQPTPVHSISVDRPLELAFPFAIEIPAIDLTRAGIYELYYRVTIHTGTHDDSRKIRVNIDKEAPNRGNRGDELIFPPEVITNGITEDYLALHGEVVAEVPRWPDLRLGDVVTYYWARNARLDPVNEEPAGTLIIGPEHLTGKIEVAFSADVIREKGTGRHTADYILRDRAGNEGPPSVVTRIDAWLAPAPINLPDPQIPEASDGLIDLEDARDGVLVNIPLIANVAPNDVIQVHWASHELPPLTIGPTPNWPLSVRMPWALLSADGHAAPRTDVVYYQWQRNPQSKNSSPVNVRVDLTVAGPDPVGPEPINPRLDPVTVKGETGDNILTGADRDKPARVVVPLYENPQAGQLLELFWGTLAAPVATYTVQAGDSAGQEIEFFVPWEFVEEAGNHPALPVYYSTFNGVNRQRSEDTPVQVSIVEIIGLKAASFEDTDRFGWINCETEFSPWNGIRVRVDGDAEHFAAGDRIELYWQGYETSNGVTPIEGSYAMFPKTLTAAEATGGFVITVLPFDPLITLPGLVTQGGSALVTYKLIKADHSSGTSPRALVKIALFRPGNPLPCLGP